jgi:drug/metabolite transporter (DMT)-like permease
MPQQLFRWSAVIVLLLATAWWGFATVITKRVLQDVPPLSLLAITGVLLVAGIDLRTSTNSSLLGNGLILMGVLCCAVYTVLTRRSMTTLDPLLVVALQQSFALAWAIRIWPMEWLGSGISLTTIDCSVWMWVLASGILYYALAFWFYIMGLQQLPASVAGLFLNCIPIFAVSGAYLVLNERLSVIQWMGAALILVAVFGMLRVQREESGVTQAIVTIR